MHAEVDPERVMAATVASSAQAADEEGAFAPIHGYTTDALLKDKRFKVEDCISPTLLSPTQAYMLVVLTCDGGLNIHSMALPYSQHGLQVFLVSLCTLLP